MTVYKQIASNKRRTVLLIALFILFIIAMGWLFSYLFDYGYSGLFLAVIIAISMSLVSYYSGDKVALFTAGAKGPITKEQNSYVYNLVENLSITAGLEMPKIYLIQDDSPNAFATGRDPKHASIALTTGIINLLENQELEGVIAHELSHIKNYDIRLMMIVIICVGVIVLMADFFLRWSIFGGRRRDVGDSRVGLILMVAGLVLMILAPLGAEAIKMAISRKREFLADASAVLLTRYPEGLATALEKIDQVGKPLARQNKATAHLYIASPYGKKKSWFKRLASTHPPIEERVKALRSMA
ncbi:MAG: M48 family metalloprotease [Patescibacteria group bacterium]